MKNQFKYVVILEEELWDNINEETVKSKQEKYTYEEINPIIARNTALQIAKDIEAIFEDDETQNDLNIPHIKWGEYFTEEELDGWVFYQITVNCVTDDNSYCIYDTGDSLSYAQEMVFAELIKEHEVLKAANIDLSEIEESVQYYDCQSKTNSSAFILPNRMDLSKAEINIMSKIKDIYFDIGEDVKEQKKIKQKKSSKNTLNKQINSVFSFCFNTEKDSIELSLKSSNNIPTELQEELTKVIQKWHRGKSKKK